MNLKVSLLGAMMVASCVGASVAADAQITYFTDRTTFNGAAGSLVLEDFEKARATTTVAGRQDSSTNNSSFQPGDLVAGIGFATTGTFPDEIFVNNGLYAPTFVMTTNWGPNSANIFLDAGAGSFGLDLFNDDYTVRIYGAGDVLLDTKAASAGFFGFTSVSDVFRVNVEGVSTFETYDNVAFGSRGGSGQVPEPGAIAMLTGLGVTGLALRRRK